MRKLFTIILLAILCANAMAYDFSAVCSTGQTLYYNITSDTEVEVTKENSSTPYYSTYPTGDLEIPESVEYNGVTYSVTCIYAYAFHSCSGLTSVTIPNSVTVIYDHTFWGCSELTSLSIGNSVAEIK
ncbi:MAG: leucine-rich repeat protein, partial [Bacteroidales bacterium]|nr:leucine-rich repeat protein [Bacteroidales bacterium]